MVLEFKRARPAGKVHNDIDVFLWIERDRDVVIHEFVHKLGVITETKVGQGKMLICAIDLLGKQDKPEARQLFYSLLRYLALAALLPRAELDTALLEKLLPN